MSEQRMRVILGHLGHNKRASVLPQAISSALSVVSKDSTTAFQYTRDNPRLNHAQRAFYEENGFLVIPKLVQGDKIDAWRERFLDLVEGRSDTGGMTKMKDISLKGVKEVSGERVVNKIQDFVWDDILSEHCQLPQVLDYVECFTGPNIMAMHTMLINKPPDPGTRTSRHPMHQDLHYFPFRKREKAVFDDCFKKSHNNNLKSRPLRRAYLAFVRRPANHIVCAWTAMENVNTENGCLFVLPGSHKGVLEPHEYPEWEKGVNKMYHGVRGYDAVPKTLLPMEKGDTVFFHPILLHGSGDNRTQRFRKAISCHYAASECAYIDVRGTSQENIAKEVEDIAKRRGVEDLDFKASYEFRKIINYPTC
ncbi:Phytanoyl-CoA dioxygenase, peroxisomal [Chionoecetes opilio]|uniref:phytanoyl-CoA dioxygenase n=1 Tax=Chionoecetes opilio TaxID=41210 RepID=A0A8J5D0L9_CHIOP|nr:Phytanoyl-CoA dioxygenase, peroxisomal [Chionoecetes opilio]